MRLFGGIKDTYKKSEAAVVVQNLLEMQQKNGLFDSDPASSATSLVDAAWTKNPHLFDGRFGQRPHKISLAASAFSNAIEVLEVGNPNSNCFTMCLGNILNEVSVNGKLYPLNNLDMDLLDTAAKVFTKVSEEFAASPLGQEINDLLSQGEDGWDEWFAKYKAAAGVHNPALAPNEKGLSLIDFMEDEPTKRAYHDGVDPEQLGKLFAEQFDITKMGFE
jgi:hypothetical protein|tara:strand:- start:2587 stop:3243 length:657 start_codon:yes stop_codon:yes gene_type:complete